MITPQLAAMGKNCLPQEGTKLASSHMVLEATKGQLFQILRRHPTSCRNLLGFCCEPAGSFYGIQQQRMTLVGVLPYMSKRVPILKAALLVGALVPLAWLILRQP